jgi:hypothetical protein
MIEKNIDISIPLLWVTQWDAHNFMRFSFKENHNLNIPALSHLLPYAAFRSTWNISRGKHTSFST